MNAAKLIVYSQQITFEFYRTYLIDTNLHTDTFNALYIAYKAQPVNISKLAVKSYKTSKINNLNADYIRTILAPYITIDEFNLVRLNTEGLRLCLLYDEFVNEFVEVHSYLFK